MSDLTARLLVSVQLLEAERMIADLYDRYAHDLDYGNEADWLDCFTPDATYEFCVPSTFRATFPNHGGTSTEFGVRYDGSIELARFAAAHSRAPQAFHKHVITSPRVSISNDVATASAYFVRIDVDEEGLLYMRAFGRYRDDLALCTDGAWRFRFRVVEVEAFDERPYRRGCD